MRWNFDNSQKELPKTFTPSRMGAITVPVPPENYCNNLQQGGGVGMVKGESTIPTIVPRKSRKVTGRARGRHGLWCPAGCGKQVVAQCMGACQEHGPECKEHIYFTGRYYCMKCGKVWDSKAAVLQ